MANEFNKQMPFSLQAEQSVLGSVLIDPEKFNDVVNKLTESDFYLEVHKLMFSAMHSLAMDQSRQIDPVTLTNAMVERGDVLAMFTGHDHSNAFGVKYQGIDIVNSLSTRYNGDAYSTQYGYRVIELDENAPDA